MVLQVNSEQVIKISEVKPMHVKEYFTYLYEVQGLTRSSINVYRFLLRPAFEMAVENDWIRKNPATIKTNFLPSSEKTRRAITKEEEEKFLSFVASHNKYSRFYDMYVVLIETGLRISEFLGLTLNDIDLKNRVLDVNHQICIKKKDENGRMFYIDDYLKTPHSKRKIYITNRAYKSFKNLIERRKYTTQVETIIDGYSQFLLTTHTKLRVLSKEAFAENLRFAVKEYNATHDENDQLPHISAHIFRHTFCSRMIEHGVDVKTVQYLMGHAQVQTSLNIYSHVDPDKVVANMKNTLESNKNAVIEFTPNSTPKYTPEAQ